MRNKEAGGVRKWLLLIGVLLGIAVITEILLLAGIFRKGKDNKKSGGKDPTQAVAGHPTDATEPTDEPEPTDGPGPIGSVDMVNVWRVKSIDLDRDGLSYRAYSYEYDESGNMTQLLWMNEEGEVDQKREFRYDAENHLVWSQTVSTAAHGANFEEENTYHSRGRLTERRTVSSGNVYRTLYEYDDNDLLISETEEYGDPPATSYRIGYTYDESGKQTLIEWFNNADIRDTRIVMEYDERGNLIRETTYSEATGEVSGMHALKYDSQNRVIEDAHYLDEGETPLYIIRKEYDEKGNLIRRDINARPELSSARTETDEYTYDERGRLIRERDYYFDAEEMALRTDTENEYDSNGMIIKVTHRNPDGTVSGYDYYEYVSFIVPYASLTDEEKEWYERENGVFRQGGK